MPPERRDGPPPLTEGIDYTVEAGRWVFTAEYHRKRGYCCGSGCRHCPYGEKPNPPAPFRHGKGE